jgi:hypothetical protein
MEGHPDLDSVSDSAETVETFQDSGSSRLLGS